MSEENSYQMVDEQDGSGKTHRIYVRFFMKAKLNETLTAMEGRPVHEDKEYVGIRVPGDALSIIEMPVEAKHKRRFAQAYRLWKEAMETGKDVTGKMGSPLADLPGITASQVEDLAMRHVRTVEQLADISDGNLPSVGPYVVLRQKARDWLENAKSGAGLAQLRAELGERDSTIGTLKRQLEELGKRFDEQARVVTGLQQQAAAAVPLPTLPGPTNATPDAPRRRRTTTAG